MFEQLLAALGPALQGFAQSYSFEEEGRRRRDDDALKRRDRLNREGVDDMFRQYDIQENARRYENTQRQARAGIVADDLAPNQEIDDLTMSFLQGTPFEARVRSQTTIPTRGFAGDVALEPGGDTMGAVNMPAAPGMPSRTWRPTYAESRQVEKDAALNDVLSDPKMAPYAGRIRAGLGTTELPHERSARELAGDDAATDRALQVEAARAKSVLDEIRLRDTLSDNPGGGKGGRNETLWKQYGAEYQSYVGQHGNKQKQRQDESARLQNDPLAGPGGKREVHYEEPLSFDRWLTERKGVRPYGGGAGAPIPVTPRASHTSTAAAARANVATPGAGPKVGSRVTTKDGKSYTVGKVYPDGSWDPGPALARSH